MKSESSAQQRHGMVKVITLGGFYGDIDGFIWVRAKDLRKRTLGDFYQGTIDLEMPRCLPH